MRVHKELSRELLATAATARAEKLATTDGGLACEETMATLAHKIAGLESPLHSILKSSGSGLWLR